jgi:hypothetical protein
MRTRDSRAPQRAFGGIVGSVLTVTFIPPMPCSRLENPGALADRRSAAELKLDGQAPKCTSVKDGRPGHDLGAACGHGLAPNGSLAQAKRAPAMATRVSKRSSSSATSPAGT